jgi:galactokinase
MSDATDLFRKHFGHPPTHVIRAPGRLEILGNHTDYNLGLVLAAAIDRYIQMAVSPRNDGRIELVSSTHPGPETFWLDKIEHNPAHRWADYCKGVLLQLRKRGVHFSGFNAAIHGTVPSGAGMSSSAALEVATALAVRQLFPYSLKDTGLGAPPQRDRRGEMPAMPETERVPLARVCSAAENEFVGVRSGLMDQISSLCGRAGNVLEIDFQSFQIDANPLPGVVLVVCDSGVKHALVAGAYNELRENCEGAARALGVATLRAVEMKTLKAAKDKLTERQFQCAHHVVSEIQRVVLGSRALRENDLALFGQYLFESHASSRDFLKNSAPELDVLVELAQGIPSCIGARLTGGGFGGATVNLVAHHQAPEFMSELARKYRERSGKTVTPVVCQIVDGAA